ncbi:MAG: gas vesicle protein, partial [Candidatus Dormibacteraeota bacterium]|nr:gas vesicle protein [Candidatus Dormibacteraeota bacterium]
MVSLAQSNGSFAATSPLAGLAEAIDSILDKGLVIDAYVRVSVIGIDLLTIEARIVIASVDTYLRFAQAVGQLGASSHDGGWPLLDDHRHTRHVTEGPVGKTALSAPTGPLSVAAPAVRDAAAV